MTSSRPTIRLRSPADVLALLAEQVNDVRSDVRAEPTERARTLGFLASQTMHFFRPIVQTIWNNPQTWDRVAKLLERRGAIELLLRRLEARA